MSTLSTFFYLLLGLLGVLAIITIFFVKIYNNLIYTRNSYKNAFAQIDVQLRRRFDLIPNLVETVKQYMQHERQTLESVINARNSAQASLNKAKNNPGNAIAMTELMNNHGQFESMLGRLLAVVENYPELKASENISQLNEELSSTENRVAFARQAFNDAVMDYNNKCELFPSNIVAGMFSFKTASLLQTPKNIAEKFEQAPQIKF